MILVWLPELLLALGMISVLIGSLFIQRGLIGLVTLAIVCAAIALYFQEPMTVSYWAQDALAIGGKMVLLSFSLLIAWIIYPILIKQGSNVGLIFALYLAAVIGGMVMLSATDFLVLFLGIELVAIPSYIFCSMSKCAPHADEAGLKYFVMGSVSSLFFLYGVSLLYGASGSLEIATGTLIESKQMLWRAGTVFLLSAFAFKAGVFPFHYWVPDVYQASEMPLSLWVISVPKWLYLLVLARIFVLAEMSALYPFVGFIGISSILFGSLMACAQDDFRRMLGYASVAQMGIVFLLFSLADQLGWVVSFSYLLVYILSLIIAWSVLLYGVDLYSHTTLASLGEMAKKQPLQAGVLSVVMASMAGIPLTIGFVAKVGAVYALVANAYYGSLAVLLLSLPLAIYYYMHVVKVLLFSTSSLSFEQIGSNYYTLAGGAFIILMSVYIEPIFALSRSLLNGVI